MIYLARTLVIFFSLLVFCLNSGLLISSRVLESISKFEESFPSPDPYSFQNILLFPVRDLTFEGYLTAGKPDRLIQKIKFPVYLATGSIVVKNHLYPSVSEQDPGLITDLFDPPDISFPFSFFW